MEIVFVSRSRCGLEQLQTLHADEVVQSSLSTRDPGFLEAAEGGV